MHIHISMKEIILNISRRVTSSKLAFHFLNKTCDTIIYMYSIKDLTLHFLSLFSIFFYL